ASELFWMARYLERAESYARVLDVTWKLSMIPRHSQQSRDLALGPLILAVHVKGDADTVKKQFRLRFFLPDRELIGIAKPLPPG
ncbi:alpha-E domain-containing protein, partial [Klebsiella pneumoniae]|uniref:alpha-E domain-containing protein n=1 Tax=Klebsiella pneumoniae TaxID=573 RepID=UPI0022EAB801